MATKNAKSAIEKLLNAPTVEAPVKKSKKKDRDEVEMPEPFDVMVALHIVSNLLKEPAEQMTKELHEKAREMFTKKLASEGNVETFEGQRGDATCNVMCKKATIKPEMLPLMDEHKISYEVEDEQPERYIINPAIMADQEMLAKLAVALADVPGLEGVAIIQKQRPVSKAKPTPQTFHELSKVKDANVRHHILSGITTIAFGQHKMEVSKALEIIKTKLGLLD